MNSTHKHKALSDDEVSQTKQTLLKLSHRLRMQIPSELIDVSRHRLASEQDDEHGYETLSSLRLAHSERVVDLLKEVEKAITRINDDTYGICVDCGREIEKNDLLRNITETHCTNCKKDEDQNSAE